MSALMTLVTLFPVALASGVNLYATVLVVGLSARFDLVDRMPAGFEVLGSTPVLLVAGILYLLEFVADKIPFLDNVWDVIHTPIRPLGAAAVALAAATGTDSPLAVSAALLAGGVALVSHGGKAGTRVAANLSNPASAVTNPLLSLAEDLSVAGLVFLALKHPVPAAILAGLLLAAILIFVPLLLRWTFFGVRALLVRVKGRIRPIAESEPLPAEHRALIGAERGEIRGRCRARGIRGAGGRDGFLTVAGERIHFTHERWFRPRIWSIERAAVVSAGLRRRFLADVVELVHAAGGKRNKVVRFAFTKDRAPLAERIAGELAGGAARRPPVGSTG